MQTSTQLIWPTVSYALTAGPTAPEATSFEPVDTTDMVNLLSGDLTYSLPLLEVPGPEGSYPLSLAYHAGIQPNEESSWVGLGWSLNPGAIARNVNGYADDHKDMQNVTRDFWEGGNISTTSVGVNIGTAGSPASVSFGLSFSQDTYKGFGLGGYEGVGYRLPGTTTSIGVSVGSDGYGNGSASIQASIGQGAADGISVTNSIGLSTNFHSVSADAGIGVGYQAKGRNFSLLGATMSSNNAKNSLSVGGGSIGIHNDNAGRIQTQSTNYGVTIPVLSFASVSLGYNYTRYWSDETATAYTNGALFYPASHSSTSQDNLYDDHAYDTYRLQDPANENMIDNPDPDLIQGGSFPNYDNYSVTAQGLSGSIRPYAFQHGLASRTRKQGDGKVLVQSAALNFTNAGMQFRFINDFSNQYRQQPGSNWVNPALNYPFDSAPSYGNSDGNFGYDGSTNRLVGSKHIDWFSNSQIINGVASSKGFIETSSAGFSVVGDRGAHDNYSQIENQIGGFKITNESGVTYHYSLPAYSFYEDIYTEAVNHSNGLRYNHLSKPGQYAYTWFLTAVTGPDYVDRGPKGFDSSDWGYWVNFSYGRWTREYTWRNPSQGFHRDLDGAFQSYSTGEKDIYYLNSISTRTHTAVFEKSIRTDGKGANLPKWDSPASYLPSGTSYPELQLKLNRILLFNNSDLPSKGLPVNSSNVIDVAGIQALGTAFLSKAIRVINFQYDYSLAPGTTNSYGDDQRPYGTEATPALSGKLTLNSVDFQGVGGASVLPPTRFYYDLPQADNGEQIQVNTVNNNYSSGIAINNVGAITLAANSKFQVGNILKFSDSGANVYATILEQTSNQLNTATYPVRYLKAQPSNAGSFQAKLTKNPPYLSENYDIWGMFKSDFNTDFYGTSESGISRRTTALSNKNTDVWSLRRIVSPLGSTITINYSGDEYQKPILDQNSILMSVKGGSSSSAEIAANIGHLSLAPYTVDQAAALFSPQQVIHVAGIKGCLASGYTGSSPWVYSPDIPFTILSIENNSGVAGLKVQAATSGIFFSQGPLAFGVYTGYIKADNNPANYLNSGGGIRVASVSARGGSDTHTTYYNYNKSGVTSYVSSPYYSIDIDAYNAINDFRHPGQPAAHSYRNDYLAGLPKLLAFAREIVPPGVMYGRVTVTEAVAHGTNAYSSLGSVAYQFTTFDKGMVGVVGAPYTASNFSFPTSSKGLQSSGAFRTRTMAIKDLTSQIGNLRTITHYDAHGAKLSETVNSYASDGITPIGNTQYDSQAATGFIAQTAANYEAKLGTYKYQGLVKESYGDCRYVRTLSGNYDLKGVISQREVYPSIQTGSTTTDYRSGIQTSSQNLAYDFYSGALTKFLAVDGYGNRQMTVSIPAYSKYLAMGPTGSPAANANYRNKNMLSQVAGTTVYTVDADNNPVAVVAASAQTWSNQVPVTGMDPANPESINVQAGASGVGDVWRPEQSYSWMPTGTTADGLTPVMGNSRFIGFDFNAVSQSLPWKLTSQVTLYNPYSNAIEAKDINGVRLATRLGFNQSKVLISGGPAAYQELAYSGAEEPKNPGDYFSGGIALTWAADNTSAGGNAMGTGNADRNTNPLYVHTGTASLRLGPYKHGFVYDINANASDPAKFHLDPSKPYRASVWTNSPSGMLHYWLDGQDYSWLPGSTGVAERRTADGWYLLDIYIPPIGKNHTTLRIGCYNNGPSANAYFDDFKVQPVSARVNSYVYDQLTGQVTDILDNNNLYTHYAYTADGRLKQVQRETFQYGSKKLIENFYHIANILDAASLSVAANGLVTINIPETVDLAAITYDTGDGKNYRAFSSTTRPYSFTAASGPNRWVRVRLQDSQGNVRELIKRII